jgi:protein translocase SecG subunit
MNSLTSVFPWIQIVVSVLLIAAVMLQRSEAGLGGAFGGDGTMSGFHTKRGFEKVLFVATIVLGVLFVATTVIALLLR